MPTTLTHGNRGIINECCFKSIISGNLLCNTENLCTMTVNKTCLKAMNGSSGRESKSVPRVSVYPNENNLCLFQDGSGPL